MHRPTIACLLILALPATVCFAQIDPDAEHLPETELLHLEEPLDVVMVRGINYFAERELADSPNRRAEKWNRDYSSVEAYEQSVAENRERLRTYIGAVDERGPVTPLWSMDDESPTLEDEQLLSQALSFSVLEGVTCEGQLLSRWSGLEDFTTRSTIILIPDADQPPEVVAGLQPGLPPEHQAALLLAENNCDVFVPTLINRSDRLSGHPDIRYTNLPHREFIYRMAFEMGRHIIGNEVQKVIAAVDAVKRPEIQVADDDVPLVVMGIGEGGLIALLAAAIDTRIDICVVSGYFAEREQVWQEPIYRSIWKQLTEFGDAEIASLIAPRTLVIEATSVPEVSGPPQAQSGRSDSAAPGRIRSPDYRSVLREFEKAKRHFELLDLPRSIQLIGLDVEHSLDRLTLVTALMKHGFEPTEWRQVRPVTVEAGDPSFVEERQQRQFNELVRYTQRLMRSSDKERARFWSNADRSSVDAWVESAEWYRDYIHEEMIGRLPEPTMPLSPRSRKVIDEPTHVGYEIVLDCYPAGEEHRPVPDTFEEPRATDEIGWAVGEDRGVIAGGILLLPKDLNAGERRPVVVCQHGLEGTPMHTIVDDPDADGWRAYKGFSTALVERGFIVYAPQNPYRGRDQFRVIQRKSNPMGRSLFSYIIEQHRRTLDWLASLPYVDSDRIGFYGLSYGGKTAVRVPPLLPPTDDHPGYCLSICSADFNEWVIKNVSSEDRYSYIFTGEYEMFEWNLGHVANYAELSSLMTPRPFMVERGHDDGVAPDEWVAWEYAKVRRHYDQLGIGELTEIEFFNGPHTINGQGTYDFLHRHLNWPTP